ncbi:hypothetical protein JTB14_014960 [Gonioctena quinquepunctata]|nr:hypothetical protein JTB14_014960 [Gonioctena quinquepunctata]
MLGVYDLENYQIYNEKLKMITAINKKQEGPDVGEVAGSVPRTYSMGAQPLPSNQPPREIEKLPTPPIEEPVEETINYEEGNDVSPSQSYHSSLTSLDEEGMEKHIEFVLQAQCRFGILIGERYKSDIYEKIKKQMEIEQPEKFELLEQLENKYATGPKSSSDEEDQT